MRREKAIVPEWKYLNYRERFKAAVGQSQRAASEGHLQSTIEPFRQRVILSDLTCVFLAMVVGLLLSARASAWSINPVLAVYATPVCIALLWLLVLALNGSYDREVIGSGTDEIRRIMSATLITFAIVSGVSYLFRADISRAYAFISLPLGLTLISASRFSCRGWLSRQRALGKLMFTTLLIGSEENCRWMEKFIEEDYASGYKTVGQYFVPEAREVDEKAWLDGLMESLFETKAQVIAITPSDNLSSRIVSDLAWRIEGLPVRLMIAPAVLGIAGTRLKIHPSETLPLLSFDEVSLSRSQRFVKRSLDTCGAVAMLVLLSPILLLTAVLVKATTKGPILFCQTRVGRGGTTFRIYKFRTMVIDADTRIEILRQSTGHSDPQFKLKNDPRITRIGKTLRRWSIDELPQLVNVLRGEMSLVGPRPHPPGDVDRYELEAYRRLALKPGMTGLWQVEGRSEIEWAEALQLDLYYVETWSVAGDLTLLLRTIRPVIQGKGAM